MGAGRANERPKFAAAEHSAPHELRGQRPDQVPPRIDDRGGFGLKQAKVGSRMVTGRYDERQRIGDIAQLIALA
jgi:hypothetical protein